MSVLRSSPQRELPAGGRAVTSRARRVLLSLVGIVIGVVAAIAYGALVGFVSPPRLEISGSEIDLGEIAAGEKTSRTVTLRNTGGQTLEIADVQRSCGCTETRLDKTTLAPNEEADLHISVVRNSVAAGTAHVAITSNDPQNPVSLVTLLLRTPRECAISPAHLTFQGLDRNALPAARRMFLTMWGSDLFAAGANVTASAFAEHLDVQVLPQPEQGKCVVEVWLGPTAPSGSWHGKIHLEDRDGLINRDVDVSAYVDSTYFLPVADFLLCGESDELERREDTVLVLKHRVDGAFNIERITLDSDLDNLLIAERVQSSDSGVTMIRVDPRPQRKAFRKQTKGHMYLHLSGVVDEVFCIPVTLCAQDDAP